MHRPSSPAPAPMPDNDDMLREILLRLPPLPSSLPRASLVCKRWLRLISDPGFLRRFRAFHRRRAPLLGFFLQDIDGPYFTPSLGPPDRIPSARFSLPLPRGENWSFLCCRHGLALLVSRARREVAVWDPVAGDQRRLALPPELPGDDEDNISLNGALLCHGGHCTGRVPLESFKVVLLWTGNVVDEEERIKVFVSVYESESDVWGEITSVLVRVSVHLLVPSVLIGNSLFWLLLRYENGYRGGIFEFDLVRQSLTMLDYPVEAHKDRHSCLRILRMEDAGLGLSITSDFTIQLWERRVTSNNGAIWMLQRTIDLDNLLLPRPCVHRSATFVHGYDEDGDVVFVSIDFQLYMIELKSLQIKNIPAPNLISIFYPYRSLYASGRCIGNGDVGVETLNNA